jgi:hypothetical protein
VEDFEEDEEDVDLLDSVVLAEPLDVWLAPPDDELLSLAGAVVVGSSSGSVGAGFVAGAVVVGLDDGGGLLDELGEVLGDVLGVVDVDGEVGGVDGGREVGGVEPGWELGEVGGVLGGRDVAPVVGAVVVPPPVGSGSGAPRIGPWVTPSTEPKMRVAWKSRDQRTGASRTLRPVRGASTIMPLPAYIATWWMPRQLVE